MPTRSDIIAMAHRLIGVLSADETPTADQDAFAGDVLDSIYVEMISSQGLAISWPLSETPQKALMGLAHILASDIAGHYSRAYLPRSAGVARLRAALISDDRPGASDYADGFVISQGQTSPTLVFALSPKSTILTGATVVFNMRDEYGTTVINGASATIVTATGTPTVSYTFTAADTRNVGRFRADFGVTYADSSTDTFPDVEKIRVFVVDPMGGTEDQLDAIGDYF